MDIGSGDDFISEHFSSVIKLNGYKPIFNRETCMVCTAYGKECSPCGETFRIRLIITDDSNQRSLITLMVSYLIGLFEKFFQSFACYFKISF